MQIDNKDKRVARKRRRRGVSYGLTAVLVILALLCGAAMGYVGSTVFSNTKKELANAKKQIADFELTMLEMYADEAEDEPVTDTIADKNDALTGELNLPQIESSDPVVVAEFTGGTVLSTEVQEAYEAALANYAMDGVDVSSKTDTILETVLEGIVSDKIAYLKAQEKGYTELSEADKNSAADLGQSEFDTKVMLYADLLRDEDMTDEEAVENAKSYLSANEGYTLETAINAIKDGMWRDKLYNEITGAITLSTSDITSAYNSRASSQEALYNSSYEEFEKAMSTGDMVLYVPEGIRAVKHIYFSVSPENQSQIADIEAQMASETDEATIANLQKDIDNLYADAEARANEAIAKLQDGQAFDEVMNEYSDDKEFSDSVYAETGYYVSDKSVMWDEKFIEAAMSIVSPGDMTGAVRCSDGVHILMYMSNIESGVVPLSKYTTEITRDATETAKYEAYQSALQGWIDEAAPKYYPELMK